ncbi:MAG TPA: GFA family protein [Micropepsaceae bacterium]|jgi:hypothetical protein
MTQTAITGGCLCKAVRYTITAEPIVTRICWCRECQYWGAGSSTVNVCFPSNTVSVGGALSDYTSTAASGSPMRRRFCAKCGTQVFSGADTRPHLTFVRAGTLDDREIAKPVMTIWTASAPSWACINDDIPWVPGQPPPAA